MSKALTIAAALAAALMTGPAAAELSSASPEGFVVAQSQGEVLPPSAAVRLAMDAVPGATPLGVKLRGGVYVVRLKQDGSIVQVAVDAVTGEVRLQR